MYVRKSRQIGAILLISGTTIGAGMLALPVLTGIAGFFPSVALFVVYWVLSVITAFLLLEVNLWFKGPVNLITMSKYTLGKKGQLIAWIIYLLLLYSLLAAYLAASGPIFDEVLKGLLNFNYPSFVPPILFLLIFGTFTFLGTRLVDYANRLLMIGLAVVYIFLISLCAQSINKELLFTYSLPYISSSVAVIVTSFGFHIVIPSLTNYLNKNVVVLKRVIIIGSLIPLIVYLIWGLVTVGTIPIDGPYGLLAAKKIGQSATYSLSHLLNSSLVTLFSTLFSFFAIVTSFLGVGLSLSHFLADGFKIHSHIKGRLITALLTFFPPLFFVLVY